MDNIKNDKSIYVDSEDKNTLNNYKYPEIPKETYYCKFCNKKLGWRGLINPFNKSTILHWISVMDCDCEQYLLNKQELKRIEEEEKLRRIEFERQQAELQKIQRVFKKSNMTKRGVNRTFEHFKVNSSNKKAYEIAKKYAEEWENFKAEGTGIIFIGKYGTGKTHLAFAIANHLLNKGIPVVYETLINLMEKLKFGYEKNSDLGYYEIIKLYCECDLLIIDDLGKEKLSEWVLEKLFQIINTRYENMLPILITTNYNEKEIIKRLSYNNDGIAAESLVSRLNEICLEVDMNFEDYRKR